MSKPGLIILDRDGVLNEIVIDAEMGTVNSPIHPSQVKMYPWTADCLKRLQDAGFGLAVATNQPGAAKGLTTRKNLEEVHAAILSQAQAAGAKILSSQICWHRAEDKCDCRKPKPGMLKQAFSELPQFDPAKSWMLGDGITDVEAGKALGLKTGFFGPKRCDHCKVMENHSLRPEFWGANLKEFTDEFLSKIK